ncbi:MAG: peptide chain release factor N(5)-glutamine methyltransferase [Bacilli bacterium]|nr:peptide chain release factor N(5)-glutamine methyltransferase [Bacilli bacterium]
MEEEYLRKYYKGDINDALKKLEEGIPVQYIVGDVNFYGYDFKVNNSVLIPRFETEELVRKTIEYINNLFDYNVTMLDIGTGSGCIAITLSKQTGAIVDAVDISKDALEVAKENNLLNNSDVNFFLSDIFSNVDKTYDVIISNPPYIAKDEEIMEVVKNNEPHIALYADDEGLSFYERILSEIRSHLNLKYLIAFEIGETQGEKVKEIALRYLKTSSVIIEKDLTGVDRYVFIVSN